VDGDGARVERVGRRLLGQALRLVAAGEGGVLRGRGGGGPDDEDGGGHEDGREAAAKHGGTADINSQQDYGFMYNRSLADPDGHIWEAM